MRIHLETEYVTVTCGPSDRGGCGTSFAMTRGFYDEMKRTGKTWYCPKGHPRIFEGATTETKLDRAEARNRHLEDQLRAATEDAERQRHQILRDRRRFANGVCPACTRSFQNVRRHMTTQHPDFDVTHVAAIVEFSCSCGRTFESLRGLRTHQGHQRHGAWWKPGAPAWRSHLTRV